MYVALPTITHEPRNEINIFLVERQSNYADFFSYDSWIMKLAYLAGISSVLN
jgi:hypothetical protein